MHRRRAQTLQRIASRVRSRSSKSHGPGDDIGGGLDLSWRMPSAFEAGPGDQSMSWIEPMTRSKIRL